LKFYKFSFMLCYTFGSFMWFHKNSPLECWVFLELHILWVGCHSLYEGLIFSFRFLMWAMRFVNLECGIYAMMCYTCKRYVCKSLDSTCMVDWIGKRNHDFVIMGIGAWTIKFRKLKPPNSPNLLSLYTFAHACMQDH